MKFSLKQKNLFLLVLAFVLAAIAPLRALALPTSEMLSTGAGCDMAASHVEEHSCCKVEKECCCAAAPVEPGNLESGVQSNSNAKFIPIKGTARPVITDWLTVSPAQLQASSKEATSLETLAKERPLYILKRSLLI